MSVHIFKKILNFLYSESVDEIKIDEIVPLYRAADLYDIQSLKTSLYKLLEKNLNEKNFIEFYNQIIIKERIEGFKFCFSNFYIENPHLVFSNTFEDFDKDILLDICRKKIA